MITSCKEALAIGGFGPELIYRYNHDSLPKLNEIINSDYDAIFEKFIGITRTLLSEVKKIKPQNSVEKKVESSYTINKLIDSIDKKLLDIKPERKSTHEITINTLTTIITTKKKRVERYLEIFEI